MERPTWDAYFLDLARTISTRATCDRKKVGALFVRDRVILSTGYNGSIRGLPHCNEVGHLIENNHCIRTIHAEQNALAQAAWQGTRIDGSILYITTSPCWICFKLIANAGIQRIVYGEQYNLDEKITETAKGCLDLVFLPYPA